MVLSFTLKYPAVNFVTMETYLMCFGFGFYKVLKSINRVKACLVVLDSKVLLAMETHIFLTVKKRVLWVWC